MHWFGYLILAAPIGVGLFLWSGRDGLDGLPYVMAGQWIVLATVAVALVAVALYLGWRHIAKAPKANPTTSLVVTTISCFGGCVAWCMAAVLLRSPILGDELSSMKIPVSVFCLAFVLVAAGFCKLRGIRSLAVFAAPVVILIATLWAMTWIPLPGLSGSWWDGVRSIAKRGRPIVYAIYESRLRTGEWPEASAGDSLKGVPKEDVGKWSYGRSSESEFWVVRYDSSYLPFVRYECSPSPGRSEWVVQVSRDIALPLKVDQPLPPGWQR